MELNLFQCQIIYFLSYLLIQKIFSSSLLKLISIIIISDSISKMDLKTGFNYNIQNTASFSNEYSPINLKSRMGSSSYNDLPRSTINGNEKGISNLPNGVNSPSNYADFNGQPISKEATNINLNGLNSQNLAKPYLTNQKYQNELSFTKQDLISQSPKTQRLNEYSSQNFKNGTSNFNYANQSSKRDKQTIQRLRKQLEEKAETLYKFNKLLKVKYNELKEVKTELENKNKLNQQLTIQVRQQISLQQSQFLKKQLFNKNREIDQLKDKIINNDQIFKNSIFQNKIHSISDELDQERTKNKDLTLQNSKLRQTVKQLQQKVNEVSYQKITKDILAQSNKIQNLKLFQSQNQKQNAHLKVFDQALKIQMKQMEELKKVIESGQDTTVKLRENLVNARRQLDQMRNQMKIWEIKSNAERKKLIMEYRLQLHQKDNQIDNANKRHKTLEEKYKYSLDDIKAKDQFFKQHLVGRTNQIDVKKYIEEILAKFSQNFDSILTLRATNKMLEDKLQKYSVYEII